MAEESNKKLFTEFPPVTTEQWEEVIHADLKGADYDKKLVWKTIEGINVRPYYRASDLEKIQIVNAKPGVFPFVRGNHAKGNIWLVRQDLQASFDQPTEANRKAVDMLKRGVQSLGFNIANGGEPSYDSVSRLLKGIDLNTVEVNFTGGFATAKALPFIVKYLEQNHVDASKVRMSIDYSPLTSLTLNGKFCCENDASFQGLASVMLQVKNYPNFRVIGVNGHVFNSCGSSIVQELGYSLAMASNYLEVLTDNGFSIDEVAPRMKFNLAISANYFMEIAKFRAARLLWAKMVDAYKPQSSEVCKMQIHAETSRWNQTVYDAYVNMLRSTTESMSAVIAGVDSLNVLPFDTPYEKPSAFSERIARNQQLLLREESYFDKIADPAAGSYYIENLTVSIAENAWKIFLATDAMGGYKEAFIKGVVQEQIQAVSNKRDMNFATRRETILGTNQFPNFNEIVDPKTVAADVVARKVTEKPADTIATPLVPYRGAQAIEEMRYRTDTCGRRPKAFMLALGNLAMRRARAQFACNFFAVAGFEVVDNIGFKYVDEGLKAALAAKSDIVVVCSSDDEYAELAPEAFEKLGNRAIFVVAGSPACTAELEAKGIHNFIHVKSNLLETLKQYQQLLKI